MTMSFKNAFLYKYTAYYYTSLVHKAQHGLVDISRLLIDTASSVIVLACRYLRTFTSIARLNNVTVQNQLAKSFKGK